MGCACSPGRALAPSLALALSLAFARRRAGPGPARRVTANSAIHAILFARLLIVCMRRRHLFRLAVVVCRNSRR
jgi:hypothetical protein